MSDPSSLTKAKLKEELKLHNIPLPRSDSLKQVYVDLYRKHILTGNEQPDSEEDEAEPEAEHTDEEFQESLQGQEEDGSDDSDSEIVFKTSPQIVPEKRSPKKRLRQTKIDFKTQENGTLSSQNMSVKDLSNFDLANELKEMGVSPGPITATTRSVYERKLIKLRQARGDSSEVSEVLETSNYEEVPDDEENQPPPKPRGSPSRRPRITEEGTRLTRRNIESVRNEPAPEEMVRTAPNVPVQKTKQPQKAGIPIWIKLILFLTVAFFVYLVYVNMEPSSNSQVPKSINQA